MSYTYGLSNRDYDSYLRYQWYLMRQQEEAYYQALMARQAGIYDDGISYMRGPVYPRRSRRRRAYSMEDRHRPFTRAETEYDDADQDDHDHDNHPYNEMVQTQVDPHDDEEEEEEEDSDTLDEMEILAAENAKRNSRPYKLIPSLSESSSGPWIPWGPPPQASWSSPLIIPPVAVHTTSTSTNNTASSIQVSPNHTPASDNSTLVDEESISSDTSYSKQDIHATQTSPKHSKKKRWPFSFLFTRSSSRSTLSPSSLSSPGTTTKSMSKGASPSSPSHRVIHTIASPDPVGDVLDIQQQKKLVELLNDPKQRCQPKDTPEEAAQVAKLDRIWVFRHASKPSSEAIDVWTGFDYKNQLLLTQYHDASKASVDAGIEIFDSHIRHGRLPVLVVPSRNQCFYPITLEGDEIATLELACLPNSSDVQFVYRQPLASLS
ncbi:uncharacterized protein BYT42DRAFT_588461 [Radiomyces spectabilis]|uniref:uncharacterized protein n=1 Tax=Radiomyces spectabilis TaxID=64574 RepID=UPI00221EF2AC|nr:uncharacterized protein BYT42DRAFT_588461 [Radiomyces spectabilis]KAI8365978.1 hypothetical protein BYT42DRAFT_588461 [Radiomyces spectabilis]